MRLVTPTEHTRADRSADLQVAPWTAMSAPPASFQDPIALISVAAAGLFCLVLGLTMFYGLPRGHSWIEERRRYIVYWQLRAGTSVGASRIWPAQVPLGISLLLLAPGAWLTGLGGLWQVPGFLLTFAAIGVMAFAAWMAFRPVKRFLPDWWVEEEQRRRAGLEPAMPPPRKGAFPTMTRRQRRLNLLAIVAFVMIWAALGLPIQYALLGLGAALVYLSATKIREPGEVPN